MNERGDGFKRRAGSDLPPDYAPHSRAERLIALGRFILAFFALVAVYFEPSTPAKYQQATYTLLAAYAAYAFAVAVLTWITPLPSRRLRLISHISDLVLFSIFVYLTEGPASPFFLYFVFSLFCATLRFTWRGILLTGIASMAIYGAVAFAAALTDPEFDVSRVLVREAYLVVVAALLVYLGMHEQRLRAELSALAAWPRGVAAGLERVLRSALEHAAGVLQTERLLLIWEENDEPWLYVAELAGGRFTSQRLPPGAIEPVVLTDAPATTFFARADGRSALLYDPSRPAVSEIATSAIGADFRRRFGVTSAIGVPLTSETLSGHLLIPDVHRATADHLALAHIVGRLVLASMEQFFFLQQVRHRAGTEERLRIARDLHDGIVQSLGGVGLQLQSIRSQVSLAPAVAERLTHLQRVLEHDQRELRELVRELRTHDDGDSTAILRDELNRIRERFALEWGLVVDVRLGEGNGIPVRLAREACRIVNESLSNAARHGSATQASVAIDADLTALRIHVRDNGRGFPFEGRFDLAALDHFGHGPRSLKERVSTLGGSLIVESGSGGASVEASVPLAPAEGP